ncbi:Predicted metal-dependent hydrolase, TIM-barrel fold [Bosea sp. 62]|nr:Predicted metal-dependent hydrolase, TIM-barrel fold [Bosea sp. 21B]CAD5294333.1 Predicted metal-dependent hydrolase, TIM-barrel fold [Bosea sp. 46]CAD5299097.1 Predicted metal-dependent hydrolase, TIM-barrel fold [Bosea sp. 7B]VVT60799.1 Predicted metal-dependent hydrolase, TIM-barrel fold [Bosea sp. EC-HK365B]VXB41066.1 Predicted metal-dependent hydrolase, TIM-barrel fold [Bosea sp. 127]VXB53148.1 Predicted metal-dependent hydrolase, TIM-barrel fold [Bosea sp. 125]VXC74035.1 Predicted me
MTETVAPRSHRAPSWTLPAGAADCHAHVFGPYERFPVSHQMHYAAPLAPAAAHCGMLERVGLTHGVLVQPGAYGEDSSAVIDALAQSKGRLRGIAAASERVPQAELDAWHTAGVRGLRFNDMTVPGGTGPFPGSVGTDALAAMAPGMRASGWHAEVWAGIDRHVANLPLYRASGVPIVLDHMAGLQLARGLGDPSFRAILEALREGWLWIKLALCRCSQDFPDYADARRFHDALVAANPERMIWGSDWPHLRLAERAPDVGHLLDLFAEWVPDVGLRQCILVDNPRQLYRF